MKTNMKTNSIRVKGKKDDKDFWLYHPAIGKYRPTSPDPIDGTPRIEYQEEWIINKNGTLIAVKRGKYTTFL